MSEENPNPQEPVPPAPVPPAGADPVPPADASPVPPAGVDPVPPARVEAIPPSEFAPVPPAGATPVPPAQEPVPATQQPVPPAGAEPVPPAGVAPVPPAQQQPIQPAGVSPVPPAQQHPVHPAGVSPVQPAQPASPQVNPAAPIHRKQPAAGGRRAATKRPAGNVAGGANRSSAPRPGAYRKPEKFAASGNSFLSILLAILGTVMLIGAFIALLPVKLDHIAGYPNDGTSSKQEPRNLLAAGQKILETRTDNATFTEKEVNDYINFRLKGVQKGALGGMMKVTGIYVELRPNEAEIFVERSFPIIGKTTMSNVVKSYFNDQKHQQIWKLGGGSVGRIKLKERSLQPVLNAFLRMSKVGAAELEVMNYMADVKLEEGKITLVSSL